MKMSMEQETVVVCSRNRLMCEIDMKRMIKTMFQGCVLNKVDNDFSLVIAPISCGSPADYIQATASEMA
jgi:hypothetical protein